MGAEVNDAGTVLKAVPATGVEPSCVLESEAEWRPSGTESQVNSRGACSFRSVPDAGVDDAVGAHQRAVDIDTDQSDQNEALGRVSCAGEYTRRRERSFHQPTVVPR